MSGLSERKEKILRAVVIEYFVTTEPISSDLIASNYELGVRSATVRNELAEITDLGLLEQPHTSAGRIPSTGGYRYFVDHLLTELPLGVDAKKRLKDASTDQDTLREIVTETTRALSRLTRQLAAASTLRDAHVLLRSIVVTALGPEKALLILVLQNGLVENRVLECPAGLTIEHVGQINEQFARTLVGLKLGELKKVKAMATGHPVFDRLQKTVFANLRVMAKEMTRGHYVSDGEEYILTQPEFQRNPAALQSMIESIESQETLRNAVNLPIDSIPGITIGREHLDARMHPLAVIRQTFFVGDDEAGTLAIIGPVRMDYEQNVALLDFTAMAVSQTLTKLMS